MTGRIITVYEYPPIPKRDFDWVAYHDGEEERGHYGWGETEAEALEDLRRLDEERDESQSALWGQVEGEDGFDHE